MDNVIDFMLRAFTMLGITLLLPVSARFLEWAADDCAYISFLIGWDVYIPKKRTHKHFKNYWLRMERINNERAYSYAVSPSDPAHWKFPHLILNSKASFPADIVIDIAGFAPFAAFFILWVLTVIPIHSDGNHESLLLFICVGILYLFFEIALFRFFRKWMRKCESEYEKNIQKSDEEAQKKLHDKFHSDDL